LNRGTLPIITRLLSLQTAAMVEPDGARVIADVTDSDQLARLLREANETVLGRSLRFESGNGSGLTLDIAGRRFLRLAAADGLFGAENCLAAPALEDENKDELIKLLQAVAAPRQKLRVISMPLGRGTEGHSVGLPVALVADLLLAELNDLDTPVEEPEAATPEQVEIADETVAAGPVVDGLLGTFVQEVGPDLMAWLIVGGSEDSRTGGPEEMVSHLQGFLEDEAEALSRQLDLVSNQPGTPICILLGATLIEGHSILCAQAGDETLLGVVEGDGTRVALAAWNAARG
jgi:hypothetical protein